MSYMKKARLFNLALLAMIVTACQFVPAPSEASLAVPMLRPGDKVSNMILTTGRLNSGLRTSSIWDFCLSAMDSAGQATRECRVPPYRQVVIGEQWSASDVGQLDADWSVMTWELYIDGQPVDLAAFGTFDENLRNSRWRGWNAVLMNLTSGSQLTLRYVLRLDQPVGDYQAGTYELVVELIADDRIGRRRVVK